MNPFMLIILTVTVGDFFRSEVIVKCKSIYSHTMSEERPALVNSYNIWEKLIRRDISNKLTKKPDINAKSNKIIDLIQGKNNFFNFFQSGLNQINSGHIRKKRYESTSLNNRENNYLSQLDDSGIYYEPADTYIPSQIYNKHYFYISNPIKTNDNVKISDKLEAYHMSSELLRNELNEKRNDKFSLEVPIYMDIDIEETEIGRSNDLNLFNDALDTESNLVECLDLHILVGMRNNINTTPIHSKLNQNKVKEYHLLSDTEINERLNVNCNQVNTLLQNSLEDIISKISNGKLSRSETNRKEGSFKSSREVILTDSNDNSYAKTTTEETPQITTVGSCTFHTNTNNDISTADSSLSTENVSTNNKVYRSIETSSPEELNDLEIPNGKTTMSYIEDRKEAFTEYSDKYSIEVNNILNNTQDNLLEETDSFLTTCTSYLDNKINASTPISNENNKDLFTDNYTNFTTEGNILLNDTSDFITDNTDLLSDSTNSVRIETENLTSSTSKDYIILPRNDNVTITNVNTESYNNIMSATDLYTNTDSDMSENVQETGVTRDLNKNDIAQQFPEVNNTEALTCTKYITNLDMTTMKYDTSSDLKVEHNSDETSTTYLSSYETTHHKELTDITHKANNYSLENEINGVNMSNSLEVNGKIYFIFNGKQIPMKFVQNSNGEVNLSLDGNHLCEILVNDSEYNSLLFRKLCSTDRK